MQCYQTPQTKLYVHFIIIRLPHANWLKLQKTLSITNVINKLHAFDSIERSINKNDDQILRKNRFVDKVSTLFSTAPLEYARRKIYSLFSESHLIQYLYFIYKNFFAFFRKVLSQTKHYCDREIDLTLRIYGCEYKIRDLKLNCVVFFVPFDVRKMKNATQNKGDGSLRAIPAMLVPVTFPAVLIKIITSFLEYLSTKLHGCRDIRPLRKFVAFPRTGLIVI